MNNTNQLSIQIQIKGESTKWLAKCEGLSAIYGHKVEFLTHTKKVSSKLHYYTITEAGIYKHAPRIGEVVGKFRCDTGFLRITEAGEVTEISKEDALAAFAA